MAVSRAERRHLRRPAVAAAFGDERVGAALDLLELMERAWHDGYHDITPPDEVITDLLLLGGGDLGRLASGALLAVTDWRDLRVAADAERARQAATD